MAKQETKEVLRKAVKAYNAGKIKVAKRLFAKIIKIEPNQPEANHNMGTLLVKSGNVEAALPFIKTALEANFGAAQYWFNYIDALFKLGRYDESSELLAIAKTKGCIGKAFDDLESELNSNEVRLRIRIEKLQKSDLLAGPHAYLTHFGIGEAWQKLGILDEAIKAYNKALAIKPDYETAHFNMGNALRSQGKLAEAIEAFNKAIDIKSDFILAFMNIGNVFKAQGKPEEAIEAYKKAIAINPDFAEAYYNISFVLLSAKKFSQGFKFREWRWKTKTMATSFLQSAKPFWNGEKRQRILVWAEQGIGDEIMFSSIIPELCQSSSTILVQCDERLIPLFRRSFSDNIVYFPRGCEVSEDKYDYHIPMGSLPLMFRKSLERFGKTAPGFLKYDKEKAQSIRASISEGLLQNLVGISWRTESPIKGSKKRNIKLADLAKALDAENTQLVCLQYGNVSDEIKMVKRDLGINIIQVNDIDKKNDIDGLASLIAACDQVVTIDNSTAHLAGALGIKTKLILPSSCDWRWGLEEKHSYWYKSVKLCRQHKVDDWSLVLRQI